MKTMRLDERIDNGMLFYEYGHKNETDRKIEQELAAERNHCKEMLFEYNHTRPGDREKRMGILKSLLGKCTDGVYIEDGVHMSYGKHVFCENRFYANYNLTIVDDGKVFIGDRTMVGPSVTICTTGHPAYPEYRLLGAHYSLPIKIGKCVWIGSNAVILPGVTIGDNSIIGAGSVVTRDIPANVVAFGNPCRVAREITERDREYYFRDLKVDFPYAFREE